jgi:hypothetical protein
MRLPAVVLLLAGLTSGAALAGPPGGEAAKPVAQIVADVTAAADAAHTVFITGSGLSSTQPLSLSIRLVAGRGGTGTISEDGIGFQIIRLGTKAYFEGGTAFWRHYTSAGVAALMKNKWIEAPATGGQLGSLTPLTSIVDFFHQLLASHGTLVVGKTRLIHGRLAFALVDTTEGGTLYVAASGPPYPLEATSPSGKGSISFEDWNQPVTLKSPAGSIALASIKG